MTGPEKCTSITRIVHRIQPSPAAVPGTAALTTWVTTQRHSRRHTGNSTRSEYIRCHLGLSQGRLTAPVFLQLSHCLAPIPSMLAWVARAPACLRYHTLVLYHQLHLPQAYRKPSPRRLALSLVPNCPVMRRPTGPATGLRTAQRPR